MGLFYWEDKMDLSLVPISELLDEVSSRTDFYVAAYQLANEPKKIIYTHWKDKAWFGNLALCAALQSDLLQEAHDENPRNNE